MRASPISLLVLGLGAVLSAFPSTAGHRPSQLMATENGLSAPSQHGLDDLSALFQP